MQKFSVIFWIIKISSVAHLSNLNLFKIKLTISYDVLLIRLLEVYLNITKNLNFQISPTWFDIKMYKILWVNISKTLWDLIQNVGQFRFCEVISCPPVFLYIFCQTSTCKSKDDFHLKPCCKKACLHWCLTNKRTEQSMYRCKLIKTLRQSLWGWSKIHTSQLQNISSCLHF